MNTLGKLVEYSIERFSEIRLRRLLFILARLDPVLVEILVRGFEVEEILKHTGIALEELERRLMKLIELTEELDHRDNPKLNEEGQKYELPHLAVVDIGDFLMAAENLADEVTILQVARAIAYVDVVNPEEKLLTDNE